MTRILVVRRKAELAPPTGPPAGVALSKTEEIRAAAAADPSATPSEIAQTLNARGIPITNSHLTAALSAPPRKEPGEPAVETMPAKSGSTGQKAADPAAAPAGLSMTDLCRAKQMCDQLGGFQRARQLLDALGELMD